MPPMSMPRLPPGAAEQPPSSQDSSDGWSDFVPASVESAPGWGGGSGGAPPATSLALSPHLDNIIGKRNSRKKRKTKRNSRKKRKTKRNTEKKRKTKRNSIKKRKTKRNSRKKRKYV